MDALTVLRREHTRIAQLFTEFDALPERACAGRKAIVREIDELVRRHIAMEAALFYPWQSETPEEHQPVLRKLAETVQADCYDPLYVSRVHALRVLLQHHIDGFAQVA